MFKRRHGSQHFLQYHLSGTKPCAIEATPLRRRSACRRQYQNIGSEYWVSDGRPIWTGLNRPSPPTTADIFLKLPYGLLITHG